MKLNEIIIDVRTLVIIKVNKVEVACSYGAMTPRYTYSRLACNSGQNIKKRLINLDIHKALFLQGKWTLLNKSDTLCNEFLSNLFLMFFCFQHCNLWKEYFYIRQISIKITF